MGNYADDRTEQRFRKWVEHLPFRPAEPIYSSFRKDTLPFDPKFGQDEEVAKYIGFIGVSRIDSCWIERCWIFWGEKCDALLWDLGNSYVDVVELWPKADTAAQIAWLDKHTEKFEKRWAILRERWNVQ